MLNLRKAHELIAQLYPEFIKDYPYYKDSNNRYSLFEEDSFHKWQFFSALVSYLIDEVIKPNDEPSIIQAGHLLNRFITEGDDVVRNMAYVQFLEGIIDRGYKNEGMKLFIKDLPEDAIDYIKGFFVKDVIKTLELDK